MKTRHFLAFDFADQIFVFWEKQEPIEFCVVNTRVLIFVIRGLRNEKVKSFARLTLGLRKNLSQGKVCVVRSACRRKHNRTKDRRHKDFEAVFISIIHSHISNNTRIFAFGFLFSGSNPFFP